MASYDRCTVVPKNKLKTCAICLLLCLANLIELSEARKVVSSGRVTKPTAQRGYANPDVAKLSYSPNYAAPPKPAAPPAPVSSPVQQPGSPPVGWNVPHNAPPPYSAQPNPGPPPPYSSQANPNINSRFNEPPPTYVQNNPSFQGAPAYPGAAAQPGFGYHPQPGQGFPPQTGGYPGGYQPAGYQPGGFAPAGYPQQPGYQAPVGGFQQPGTVIHHYEQPSSGGSGLGTVLGAGVAGLAAGAGGAALYDALKPKDSKEAAPATTDGTTTTTTTTTLAPINPNGDAPLAPIPVNPASETPLAPMPTDATTTASENPLGIAPLASFPVSDTTLPDSTVSTAAVEIPNAAMSVEPQQAVPLAPFTTADNITTTVMATDSTTVVTDQPAVTAGAPTTAPQLGAQPAAGKASYVQFSSLLILIPALCRFLLW
ncbi:basic proline-rich protein-like [Topomyia yanbarensis]|uniref:basic proline-rich protein-like n=1 Tax=Topomyia yanbarensis TaxID=2498891 RepID=UPI00273BC1A7|nr:basic proline-rich protein-like [Topomyia yanbarensis]XP_058820333.1 basic proline-rich protein-like [Topomyia yanbarensis]XP_058820334.1 basic proline-rich protein-like [Topomyia yanbarensis]XP_058820335.1 basic proline-rich protein-like [Topomyia yanbarensis]XP_058820336.1 basic proline-rich protein-like [Topomyia yanbarensis]